MAIRITDDMMTLEIDNPVVATERFSEYAPADGDARGSFPRTQPGCSAATRQSRLWQSPSASRRLRRRTTRP